MQHHRLMPVQRDLTILKGQQFVPFATGLYFKCQLFWTAEDNRNIQEGKCELNHLKMFRVSSSALNKN